MSAGRKKGGGGSKNRKHHKNVRTVVFESIEPFGVRALYIWDFTLILLKLLQAPGKQGTGLLVRSIHGRHQSR